MPPISLLCTVSDERANSTNLRFVCRFFPDHEKLELTLLYVVPRQPGWRMSGDKLMPEMVVQAKIDQDRKKQGAARLTQAKEWLVKEGLAPQNVRTKVIESGFGTVEAIVTEGHNGMYDALLLGRRELSWLDELFEESIAHQILWKELDYPVWVCRSRVKKEKRGILLCADGSDASLRMADHVGYILAKQKQYNVTVLSVRNKKIKADPDVIFESAVQELTRNGLKEAAISTKVVSGDPYKQILREAGKGDYAVVAAGRNRGEPNAMERIFPGSVTTKLFKSLEGAALWVSR